jgi:hypothetical protein
MDELAKLLKIFNDRHPEYRGMVYLTMFDDKSGSLYWHDTDSSKDIDIEICFQGKKDFRYVCLNK